MVNIARALVSALLLGCAGAASAQAFPSKPVRFVIGYPPGGVNDILARVLAPPLGQLLEQPVVIDNRPGANGTVGADHVAKSQPDGYTLWLTGTPFAINAGLYAKLAYDTVKDFTPVARVATGTFILVVHPSVPANSVRELVALAKSRPGSLNYASSGQGAPSHVMGELFKLATETSIVHVPYKGAGPAVTELLAGQVQVAFEGLPPLLPHVRAGRLRALAVMNQKRSPALADLPTIAEATGQANLGADTWYALFAPAGTPAQVVQRVNGALLQVLGRPDVGEKLAAQGLDPSPSTPGELGMQIISEVAKWSRVVKSAGIKIE
jgi:tripartite-type tricarboxylate transporter receptor subunit TctC